jgi:apolipoprotein N-acyltransferase
MRETRYDKIHLVPFGEFTPGGKFFQWMNNMEYGQSEFTYRKFNENLKMTKDDIPFSPMICYDSVFPQTLRSFCAKGSQYNILITNDVWFGRSVGPYQHASLAIVRSIETRKSMVRSANAGISMFIDEKGRVLKSLPLYTTGTIDASLKASSYESPYVRTGNLFGYLMSIIALGGLIISLWPRKK